MFFLLVKSTFYSGNVVNPRLCSSFADFVATLMLTCITTSNCCQLAGGNVDSVKHGAANRQCSCDLAQFNVLPGCSPCNIAFRIATKDFAEDRVINATFTVTDQVGFLEKPLGLNVHILTLRSLTTEKKCCADGAFVVLRVFALRRRMPMVANHVTRFLWRLQTAARQTTSQALTGGEISKELSAKQKFPGFSGTAANCLTGDIGLQTAGYRRTLSSLANDLVYPQRSEIESQLRWPPYVLRVRADKYSDLVTLTEMNSARRSGHVVKLLINGKRLYSGAKFTGSLGLHVTLEHSNINFASSRNAWQFFSPKEVSPEHLRNIFERNFMPKTSNEASRWSTRCATECVSGQQRWAPTLLSTINPTLTSESTSRSELDGRTPQLVSRKSGHSAQHSTSASAYSQKGSRKADVSKEKTIIISTVSVAVVMLAVAITLGLLCYCRRRRQSAVQVATDLQQLDGAKWDKILKSDSSQKLAMFENELYESALGLLTQATQ